MSVSLDAEQRMSCFTGCPFDGKCGTQAAIKKERVCRSNITEITGSTGFIFTSERRVDLTLDGSPNGNVQQGYVWRPQT